MVTVMNKPKRNWEDDLITLQKNRKGNYISVRQYLIIDKKVDRAKLDPTVGLINVRALRLYQEKRGKQPDTDLCIRPTGELKSCRVYYGEDREILEAAWKSYEQEVKSLT